MNEDTLLGLEQLNQLRLSEEERAEFLAFFDARMADMALLEAIDTSQVERMVHVMPMMNVLRQDIPHKAFDRDSLQADAPETMDGYWQVPRVAE